MVFIYEIDQSDAAFPNTMTFTRVYRIFEDFVDTIAIITIAFLHYVC